MGALHGRFVGGVALVLLVACNAMTGLDALTVGPESPEESSLVAGDTSRGGSKASTDSGASSGRAPHDPLDDGSRPSSPPTQTDAGFDSATTEPPGFTDRFDRADNPTIGNGWVEKADHFSIAGGAVLQSGTGDFRNLIVSRPEVILDVQLSVEFVYGARDGDPSLYARMQPPSDNIKELVGYTFYAYPNHVAIDRQEPDGTATALATVKPSPALAVGQTYRMILRVTGTAPVTLEATVLKSDGSPAATLSALDSSAQRVASGGKVGFGSGDGDGLRFDNFVRVDL